MSQRVLITGGAGYIGSVLTERLVRHNYFVTVVDNFMYGQFPLAHLCNYRSLEIINGDARDPRIIEPIIKDYDTIIPLAAIVGAPACGRDELGSVTTNLGAIDKLCKMLSPRQQVIYPTTNSGYGIGGNEPCTEESPLKPLSGYGVQKVEAENIVMQRENSVSLRLATVFGMSPRMRLDLLVNDFVYRAMTDKFLVLFEHAFRRNYIHVRDVATTFEWMMLYSEQLKSQVFNVGLSDANMTKLQLAEAIRVFVPELVITLAEVGKDPDKRDYIVSNAKLEKTGWLPSYSLNEGIKELLCGFRMFGRKPFANV